MRFYKKINATAINAVELDAVQVGFECLIVHFFKSDTQARQRFFFTFYWHETQPRASVARALL